MSTTALATRAVEVEVRLAERAERWTADDLTDGVELPEVIEMTVARVPDERLQFSQAERIGAARAPAAPRPRGRRGRARGCRRAPPPGRRRPGGRPTGEQPGRVLGTDEPRGHSVDDQRHDQRDQCAGERDGGEPHHLPVETGYVRQRERLEHANGLAGRGIPRWPDPRPGSPARWSGPRTEAGHAHTLPSRRDQGVGPCPAVPPEFGGSAARA